MTGAALGNAWLLRHEPRAQIDDAALAAQAARWTTALPGRALRVTVHRGLTVPLVYVYFEDPVSTAMTDAARVDLATRARALPAFASGALTVDRLARRLQPPAASAGAAAPFRYVVETDPAAGWEDELARWYDTEHMPGLAAVSGCVGAQRFVNLDSGPRSHAVYDLVDPGTTATPAWLAVRGTPWSDRVRPQFRNTRRTMLRSLPTVSPVP